MAVADMLRDLTVDPWRDSTGFSRDLAEANEALFDTVEADPAEAEAILADWLRRNQPCLFGRAAALRGYLHYCILSPTDLQRSDDWIRERIQLERRRWRQDALKGVKSGFVILAVSRQLALATPNGRVAEIAKQLCSLYLLTDIELDTIYLDDLFLEVPGHGSPILQWKAGVNYFSAQGDRR